MIPADVVDVDWFRVDDESAAGAVRRAAMKRAVQLGFDEQRVGEVGIVATELATNLVHHAVQGTVGLRTIRTDVAAGLQLLVADAGPGMEDFRLSSMDGTSTTGTLGIGLGAVARLATVCDSYSLRDVGTVIVATIWPHRAAPWASDVAAVTRPITGEEVCGDACAIRGTAGCYDVLVADGLGHGPMAATASQAATRVFRESLGSPTRVLEAIHLALRSTRGAAAAVAQIDSESRTVTFAGVGNISGWVVGMDGRKQLVSLPGIVGHQARSFREVTVPIEAGDVVVLHSDGLTDKWDLGRYPGILVRDPAIIAATLLRDAGIRHDDASVLVVRPS